MLELFESRMAQNKKMQENSTFIDLTRENWLQVRHIDTVRVLLAMAYAAIFTATLAYIVQRGVKNLPADHIIVLLLPLLVISAVWLGFTLNLNAEAGNYIRAIRNAFNDGKIVTCDKDEWQRYIGMPLSPAEGISKWLTTGNLLALWYLLVGAASLTVIIIAGI